MKILLISGSSSIPSTNTSLLRYITKLDPINDYDLFDLSDLPLFLNKEFLKSTPTEVESLRTMIEDSDAVIISTPEYLHGIPSMLKSSFEWLSASGVWKSKRTIAICYTPAVPRGEKAMSSLLNTLQSLEAQVLVSILLDHTDIQIKDDGQLVDNGGVELLKEALDLLL